MNKFNIITFKSIVSLMLLSMAGMLISIIGFSYNGNFLYSGWVPGIPLLLVIMTMILWIWHPKGAAGMV